MIHADGECHSAEKLSGAASTLGMQPLLMQLRYFQTLTEVATEKNSTVVFPLPIELIGPLVARLKGPDGQS